MSFRKRVIPDPYIYSPMTPSLSDQPPQVAQAMNQAALTGIIDQLGALFLYSHELFNDLLASTSALTEKISLLNTRIEVLHDYLPQVENYLNQSHVSNLLATPAVLFKSGAPEDYQFLTKDSRPSAVHSRYAAAKAPPNFALLDECFPEDPSCMRHYSYPDFFIEEWVNEMKRQHEEQRRLRRERRGQRAAVAPKEKKVVKRVARKRDNVNALGAEFASPKTPAAASSSSPATAARQPAQSAATSASSPVMTAADGLLLAPVAAPVSQPPPPSPRPGPPLPSRTDAAAVAAQSAPVEPPPPAHLAPMPPAAVEQPPSPSPRRPSKKDSKPKKDKKTKTSAPAAAPLPPSQPPVVVAPPAAPVAPPPPPPPAPAPAPVQRPAAAAAAAPPPPGPPPPPPPPAAAPAAAPAGGRSALLSSIQAGTQLRSVGTSSSAAPGAPRGNEPTAGGAGFNVAKILSRRAAMEFSDSDDESSAGEEWED